MCYNFKKKITLKILLTNVFLTDENNVLNIIDLRAWLKVYNRFVKLPGNENFHQKHLELKLKNLKVATKEVGVHTFHFEMPGCVYFLETPFITGLFLFAKLAKINVKKYESLKIIVYFYTLRAGCVEILFLI